MLAGPPLLVVTALVLPSVAASALVPVPLVASLVNASVAPEVPMIPEAEGLLLQVLGLAARRRG